MTPLEVAAGEVGYREGPNNATKYGQAFGLDHVSWCAIFVWWCHWRALGIDLRKVVTPSFASVDAAWRAGKAKGMATTRPQPGDMVIFHFPGEHAGGNHTGLFVADAGSSILTIEGNTGANNTNGGGVMRRTRPKSLVLGYLHLVDAAAPPEPPPPEPPAPPAPALAPPIVPTPEPEEPMVIRQLHLQVAPGTVSVEVWLFAGLDRMMVNPTQRDAWRAQGVPVVDVADPVQALAIKQASREVHP